MKYDILVPNNANLEDLVKNTLSNAFAENIIDFINQLSIMILGNKEYKVFPELMAMAFWMRKSNILAIKQKFIDNNQKSLFLPRGTIFHIAPSNVDTIFMYSWFLSMLVGNKNIVRISSKETEQLVIVLKCLNELCSRPEHSAVRNRFVLVNYGHDQEITNYFSSLCDMRIIWGGDNTIANIRKSPLPPHATEMTFANKFSLAAINANEFIQSTEKDKIIHNFYNDSYWFNQMACSSPRLVVWVGNNSEVSAAKNEFWRLLQHKVKIESRSIEGASMMEKYVASCRLAITNDVSILNTESNLLIRVELKEGHSLHEDLHCGNGLFYEMQIEQLQELRKIIKRNFQTLSIFGFGAETITQNLIKSDLLGLDRIVKLGNALQFNVVWDGYNLLRNLQREIYLDVF